MRATTQRRKSVRSFQSVFLAASMLLGGGYGLWALGADVPADKTDLTPATSLSPFGIGSCALRSKDLPKWIPQMAAIGITNLRSGRDGWGFVEPTEGQWVWDGMDQQLDFLASQGIATGGLLNGNVSWNTKDPRGTLPVNNLPGWSKYVSELVKHANGRIKLWEVWNEPPNGIGRDQTSADYAKIVIASYDAAKAADPTCLVGLTAKSAHVNFLEQAIKAGAKDHFDYIVLHPYEVLGGVADNAGTEAVYMNIVPTVRKMLAAQNPAKVNAPVIFTEVGCNAGKRGKDVQANALVKAYTMGIAQGVTCIQWFEGMDGDSGPMGLLETNGRPRPAYTALWQMIEHLGKYPTYLGWVLLNNRDYGFVFQGAKEPVLITWAPKGNPDHVDFGKPVQIVNPITVQTTTANTYELTVSPVLVLNVPEGIVSQAKSNKAKPFPWRGDYTNAKSISITMGEKNVEEGLHTLSGDAVAADVIAYGGGARSGEIPKGNMFVVDPNFMSYATEPIEITAIVRRNAANDPANISLEYECNNADTNTARYAYKKAPMVYEVPDNKSWHAVTWKIDDPQFDNMYNYSFRFNTGKYYVQSVIVTKVAK